MEVVCGAIEQEKKIKGIKKVKEEMNYLQIACMYMQKVQNYLQLNKQI